MFEVEVYDLCEGVHFCGFELLDEFREALFKFGVDDWFEAVFVIAVVERGLRGEVDGVDDIDTHFDKRLHDHVVFLEHEALGVGVDAAAFAPRGPDGGFGEADAEAVEVFADLEGGAVADAGFFAGGGEEDVHESYEVFRGFGLGNVRCGICGWVMGDHTIPPAESKLLLSVKIPSIGTSPTVGLSAYNAARFAGVINDPSVSVPIARALNPDATLTAEPVDEPPGAESSQCNFLFAMCLATYGDWH